MAECNTVLIQRNTTIPTRKSEVFSTAADNQTSVEINVMQGERPMSKDNKSLGRFTLVGIPSAPRGIPQIEVTFDIDANGILNVNAKDLGTGKEQKITITGSSGLSDSEIEDMVKSAESHAEEDKEIKEKIETRNKVENLVYSSEKVLSENRDKISEDDAKNIEAAIEKAKAASKDGSVDEMNKAVEETDPGLHTSWPKLCIRQRSKPEPGLKSRQLMPRPLQALHRNRKITLSMRNSLNQMRRKSKS